MAKILSIEIKKDKNGNDYKSATLDEVFHGKNRFNVFLKHTRYNDVLVGAEFAVSDFAQDGQYINLIDPEKGAKKGFSRGVDPKDIAVAQDRKKEDIREAMDSKEYAIKVSGTARDATLITVELMKERKLDAWDTIWIEVREKLWNLHDREKGGVDIF